MYKNLILYRNELKNKMLPKYKILGIVTEIILSKELFEKNIDLTPFLLEVFNVTYKDYVMKSRTMILARTNRLIDKSSGEQVLEYRKKLTPFILEKIDELNDADQNKNDKNLFSGWVN
ncbi:hypothetical protein E3Z71_11495 [Listeria monocytogenes]|uniref:Uncharacterized protein n=1 Tax=Listeria monocytogenes TaxID=1639 RepID=A0AAN2X8N6_LISMN|nr:hypothetical protein [Listeria monocytogenes]HBM3652476.1 hypothetical protein [Listeria innocua]EAC3746591.1 hypothetical protein [Listeria monocytogenes]EAC9533928.1 hypothetical protein [Listeria monocytogenes]EAD5573684.1 hypothetical protein [Listeria monocytogenes]EAD6488423.1 hypothetical protein [Listeria monocytogenes]